MKISCIKYENDNKNFNLFKMFGVNVVSLENPEQVDNAMKELIDNNYDTIFLSNEIAGFSEDLIKKYKNDNNINIIIATRK